MKIGALTSFFATILATACADPLSFEEYVNAAHNAHAGDVEPLILSGTEVPIGEALYTTGLRRTATGGDFCGGSLIDELHVLTAAHCSRGGINYVSVGSHYKSGALDGVRVAVKKQTRHPTYVASSGHNDFLVLELASPIDTTVYPPVKLAGASGVDIVDGKTSTVMGWGSMSEGGASSNVLLKVDISLVSLEDCAKKLKVDSTMVCAGGEKNKDACQGDSGGPLIVKSADGSDVLIGVVSWGDGCGMEGYPGVYSRVPVAAEWIKSLAPNVTFTN